MNNSPLAIQLLMHYHAVREPFHHTGPTVTEPTTYFLQTGLIEPADFGEYCTTAKGADLVKTIRAAFAGDLTRDIELGARAAENCELFRTQLDEIKSELIVLREYRAAAMAFNDAQGEGFTLEDSTRAEQRLEAAERACHALKLTGKECAACNGPCARLPL